MSFILEPSRKTEIVGSYDTIVVGGGIAGVAAALASARQGARTLLVEKSFMLGGLATAGLVTIYLPLCDGEGRQVSFGIAEELIRLSVKHGYERWNKPWFEKGYEHDRAKERYECVFNANMYALQLEELLLEEGVELLYGTLLVDCALEGDALQAIVTENKSGRQAYAAKQFIDCTGDADLGKLAGVPTKQFRDGNVLAAWYYYLKDGVNTCKTYGFADTVTEEVKIIDENRFVGLEGREISDYTIKSHRAVMEDYLKFQGGIDKKHALTMIATTPQLRMTRRVAGEYDVDIADVHKYVERSVGLFSNWRKKGDVFALPYESLYSAKLRNLSFAGRCISATDPMWDVTRVIPVCAVSGEAVGVASALCIKENCALAELDIKKLQKILVQNGVVLNERDL